MRTWARFFSIALMAIGAVWLLQGIGILPGSFMTGQSIWAVIGSICILAGGGLLYASRKR